MIVVSDTTPLNYLALVGEIELLPKIFGRVLIPPAVLKELMSDRTPEAVRRLLVTAPSWLEIKSPSHGTAQRFDHLDAGEAEAIALALETGAELFLVDDRAAYSVALGLGLAVTGTLGVLDKAAELGLIDLAEVFSRLQQTSFRGPASLMARLIEADTKRKRQG